MSKLSLADITTLANATSAMQTMNSNNQKLEDAINDCISRDGTAPNMMEADLDLNSHRLLNVADPVYDSDGCNYGNLKNLINDYAGEIVASATFALWNAEQFTATAGQTEFTLVAAPASLASMDVSVDGVTKLAGTDYYIDGNLLVFTAGLSAGQVVQARYGNVLPVGATSADLVEFIQTGSGAILRDSQDKMREVISPEDFGCAGDGVTDDTANMQLAFTAAAGKTLRLTPGKTYLFNSGGVRVKSNTRIDARGATVKRGTGSTANRLITADTDGVTGGYTACTDVTILGGTWDGNYPTVTAPLTAFGFCHSRRIRIADCYMKNVASNHYIELNSTADAVVTGCTFDGGAEQNDASMEAVQIDGAISSATFSGGAPYDNTFCSNIKIINNTFNNCGSGVGTHSSVASKQHLLITVAHNVISSSYYYGVRVLNWANSSIANNHFYGGAVGIYAYCDGTINDGLSITGNTFLSVGLSSAAGAGNGHAIYLVGNSGGTEQYNYYVISNNVIRDCQLANSGSAIKVNYCPFGTINGNSINNIQGSGITIFGNGGQTVVGNYVQNCGSYSINAQQLGSIRIGENVCDTINYVSITRSLVMGNIVATAAGITASGTNTNTTAINNLVNTVFA